MSLFRRLVPFALLTAVATACSSPVEPASLPPSPVPLTVWLPPTPVPPDPAPLDLYLTPDDVFLYPGPELYAGDLVTFDVTPRNLGQIDPRQVTVRVYGQSPGGAQQVAEAELGTPTFDRVPRARLPWAWDTAGLSGEQQVTVWIDPDDRIQEGDEDPTNNAVTVTVRLLPAVERPAVELGARWTTTVAECCVFHTITGTAAERDLTVIGAATAQAVADVQETLGVGSPAPLDVYLINRVIGHGGYVRGGLVLSYLDRHYAGYDLATVLRHELCHLVLADGSGEGQMPALLQEGLAVWVAGGHYRPEPIPERAAALLQLGWYVPLRGLADDFYAQQHEIGYLESAAFVAYLIETYGWDEFQRLRDAVEVTSTGAAEALEEALATLFDTGLLQVEQSFQVWLRSREPTDGQVRDMRDTVYLFEAIRRYQQVYEPASYFVSGWLTSPAEAEARGVVADLLRHPRATENVALETMLIAAQQALERRDYAETERLLEAVNDVLDRGSFSHELAAEYVGVAETLAAVGYEAQRIDLREGSAIVHAIADWPGLEEFRLARGAEGWAVVD